MKFSHKRTVALFLAFLLALTPIASASEALGHELFSIDSTLGPGTVYTDGKLWSDSKSDLRQERYLTYSPNPGVTPRVVFGNTVLQKGTLGTMAKGLEGTGKRVLAGANGDYFVLATGAPVGMVVTDGILRSSSSYNYSAGFLADGSAFIGQPNLSMGVTFGGVRRGVIDLNKVREKGGYYFFTEDFGPNTQNSKPGIDVVLRPVSNTLDLASARLAEETRKNAAYTASVLKWREDQLAAATEKGEVLPVFDPIPPFVPTVQLPAESTALPTRTMIGKTIAYTVDQVIHAEKAVNIPKDYAVLSVNGSSDPQLVAALESLTAGDVVSLDISSADTRWNNAVSAISGIFHTVANGKLGSGWSSDTGAAPRTAIGVKADGSTILYTLDGRQSGYSVGGTITQVAQRLMELGCVEAICLDGGGSTTFGTTASIEESFVVNNRPSDGAQRAVTNALFFVSTAQSSGQAGSLALSPGGSLLLAGAALPLTPYAIDTNYYPIGATGGVTYSATNGTVSPEGVLTAGPEAGPAQVTAVQGSITGTARYTVVTSPSRLTVKNEADGQKVTSLNFDPKGTASLSAEASYYTLPLVAQDHCFLWAVTPELGTIDQNGLFTAGDKGGSGFITVSAGKTALSIPITVASHILTLESFEGDLSGLTGSDTVSVTPEKSAAHVRYGKTSLRLDYDSARVPNAGGATLPLVRPFVPGENHLSLWVYGNQSPVTLSALLKGGDGILTPLTLTDLNFDGWKQVTVALPAGATGLEGFTLTKMASAPVTETVIPPVTETVTPPVAETVVPPVTETEGTPAAETEGTTVAGTIWLDQLTTANEPITDGDSPTITVTVSGGTVTATVLDNIDRVFPKEAVRLACDGVGLDFSWDPAKRTLSAALPPHNGLLHRVTVTAVDASGNIGRGSFDILPTDTATPPPFADTTGHWAASYAWFLWNRGVSNGITLPEGTFYQPDKNITRGEFSLMVARWMGLDVNTYADVVLPFADATLIPDWMQNGIKTMYALGVLTGSAESDGLYAYAEGTLTRAESMAILGRIQPRGYRTGAVTYTDQADIPLWAMGHIQSLTAQGVVNGYNGALRPSDPVKRSEVAKLLFSLT
ncbi:MAG: phosphodiester glycosidase family protein [Oscillospiraceae bacterium]